MTIFKRNFIAFLMIPICLYLANVDAADVKAGQARVLQCRLEAGHAHCQEGGVDGLPEPQNEPDHHQGQS